MQPGERWGRDQQLTYGLCQLNEKNSRHAASSAGIDSMSLTLFGRCANPAIDWIPGPRVETQHAASLHYLSWFARN